MTDSSTGGYIQPNATGPAPLEDAAFDVFVQGILTGITGLPGNMVFLRWQPAPPNRPTISQNWASIGLSEADSGYAYEAHDPILVNPPDGFVPPPNGYDITIEQQDIELLCSFYGPAARTNCGILRSGLQVAQNREAMGKQGFSFTYTGRIRAMPELINDAWYARVDMSVFLKREIVRNYPILDLVEVPVTVTSDTGFVNTRIIEEE
jgi:hypothetical protein